ncbi:MAG: glycosyltransferase [Candidatus Paceibacterota bacterium]
MKISFVIPAHNEEVRLPTSLASIERALARGAYDAEVIVVNNGSVDRTGEVARSYDWVRVVDEPRLGLPQARQAGFEVATGDLIANVDADTMLPDAWLDTVLAEFARDENLAALSGPHVYYDLSIVHRAFTKVWYFFGYVMHLVNHYIFNVGAMLQGGNFVVRRTHMQQIGGFDTSIKFYGEDTDVAKRISQVGRVKWTFKLPIYTSGRRLKKEGTLRTALKYATNYVATTVSGRPISYAYTDIRDDA